MPFVDRDDELAWLADGWPPQKAQLRILYGRRRVGKSALLDEFARGKRCVIYQAVEGATADQLRDLTAALLAVDDDPVLRAAPLPNWEAALGQLSRMSSTSPLLVVFDEYQYAAEADPTLASHLQRWWSRDAVRRPIYLVLCGSYIRFFEKNVLAGPAYGRATGVLHLHPFAYRHLATFFPAWTPEDWVRAYAVAGGIPYYLEQLDPTRSLVENIQKHVLRRGSLLYEEAELVVREELREPRTYYSILRAISDGCTRASEISNRIQLPPRSEVSPYLHTLQALGLVAYRSPVIGPSTRRGVWMIADPYLLFWFRFVLPNKTLLEHGANVAQVYRDQIEADFDHFVAQRTFENICRSWVVQQVGSGKLDRRLDRIGAWWGPIPNPDATNPRRQKEAEVDIVAVNSDRVTLIGEAKWTREPVGFGVLNHLREVARSIPGVSEETRIVLFGRAFDDKLSPAARSEGITLVTPRELFSAD